MRIRHCYYWQVCFVNHVWSPLIFPSCASKNGDFTKIRLPCLTIKDLASLPLDRIMNIWLKKASKTHHRRIFHKRIQYILSNSWLSPHNSLSRTYSYWLAHISLYEVISRELSLCMVRWSREFRCAEQSVVLWKKSKTNFCLSMSYHVYHFRLLFPGPVEAGRLGRLQPPNCWAKYTILDFLAKFNLFQLSALPTFKAVPPALISTSSNILFSSLFACGELSTLCFLPIHFKSFSFSIETFHPVSSITILSFVHTLWNWTAFSTNLTRLKYEMGVNFTLWWAVDQWKDLLWKNKNELRIHNKPSIALNWNSLSFVELTM